MNCLPIELIKLIGEYNLTTYVSLMIVNSNFNNYLLPDLGTIIKKFHATLNNALTNHNILAIKHFLSKQSSITERLVKLIWDKYNIKRPLHTYCKF
jgi:Holliday junction resolvasome RuvABC ATP-dependent DNA helicase subunit